MRFHNVIIIAGSIVIALLIVGGVVIIRAIALNTPEPTVQMKSSHPRLWIVSGGQTGVDRAALDTALSLFMPVRGWCPKGRLAEDGRIPPIYPLQETTSTDYAVRTEWNVRDSDGTLILSSEPLEGGTKLTVDLAQEYKRPVLVINSLSFNDNDITRFWNWIRDRNIRILNVAGPRESAQPGVIYKRAQEVLKQLFE
ncbi:MAG: putative molybdenum carrier protein [Rhizonema sp. NSF051]|nr:putative molybdenum carrier protein [Rhizonema sp. NSF051]